MDKFNVLVKLLNFALNSPTHHTLTSDPSSYSDLCVVKSVDVDVYRLYQLPRTLLVHYLTSELLRHKTVYLSVAQQPGRYGELVK